MTGYSTREVSEVLGLPVSTILSWTRAGLLSPARGPRGAYYYSFQDVALLRAARELLASEVPAQRVKRALEVLRERLPAGRPLSAANLIALGGEVLIRERGGVWEPASGQMLLELPESDASSSGSAGTRAAGTEPAAILSLHPARRTELPREAAHAPTADDWYDAAVDLEAEAPERARDAYLQALELDPGHAEAHLNLGRLLHEAGEVAEAEVHYRTALEADPASARAFYNLGVALEDQGRRSGAVEAYEAALRLDADLAVAHFNLSRLFESLRRPTDALAHLAAYKRILDRGGLGA